MRVSDILYDTDLACSGDVIRGMLKEAVYRAYGNKVPVGVDAKVTEMTNPTSDRRFLPARIRSFIKGLPNLTSADYRDIRSMYETSFK